MLPGEDPMGIDLTRGIIMVDFNTLAVNASNAVSSAKSPEEAYKIFMGAVSQGLTQVMADALQVVVDQAVQSSAANSSIAGWQNYIRGCALACDFGAPGANSASSSIFCAAAPTTTAITTGGGISVSVGGTWSF